MNQTREEKEKDFADFTVSELKEIISETILTEEDRKIAEYRFIKLFTQDKISEKIGLDIRTVQRRLTAIKTKLRKTINKRH